ncbi:NADPH oxidase isoform X2 [Andrena cerasifolii]|uniref:NADPH oxidase isoform X2 n=1 Tax=Andrena cerasifolii TaxID=2819439 RepID=UPI0040383A5E
MESDLSCIEHKSSIARRRAITLEQCSQLIGTNDAARYNRGALKQLFSNQVLLEKLFSLFDQDEDKLLKQNEWIELLKGRLTNEKQSNFIGQIEIVAYNTCGDDPISFMKFQEIFSTKEITDEIFQLIDQENAGCVMPSQIMEFISNVSDGRPCVGFDKDSLEWLEKLFKQTVGNAIEISREEFNKIVTSKNPFFTDRVFQIFDRDNSGSISLQEFLDAMHQLAGKTPDDKFKFLFKVYDIDGDGLIQLHELEHVMRACMEENGMQFSDEQIEELTIALFEDADQDNRGAITVEALKNQLKKHEGLLENLSISIDRWLVPPKPKPKEKSLWRFVSALRPYQLTKPYMKNNYVYITFISIFIFINIILFLSRIYEYRRSNGYVMLARACGTNVVNDEILNHHNYTLSEWLFTSRPSMFGFVEGYANPTGIVLALLLTVITVCSMPFVRRGGCFEIFYWSHLLYIPFWILMMLHGPNFWKWFIGPGIIYLFERSRRIAWSHSELGKTYISSGLLLPSKVTHLVVKKPLHFDFNPGDYVFVSIPIIARYEWHPFTISSAPEQEDYIWLHIRAVGEWTNSLYSYFEKEQMKFNGSNMFRGSGCSDINTSGKIFLHKKQDIVPNQQISSPSTEVENHNGLDNHAFVPETDKIIQLSHYTNGVAASNKVSNERRYHSIFMGSKMPLEKSFSVPDMQTKRKKRDRLMTLRDYARSESERNLNDCQMRYVRLKSLDQVYSSPQNKELAESFRYMRTKPTIIAFKTPSLQNCEHTTGTLMNKDTMSQTSVNMDRSPATNLNTEQVTAEAGALQKQFQETSRKSVDDIKSNASINYIVEKPLEIFLDGPYGAPSSHIFQAQHAVLIATGIGVTPFASILQSIMHRYWKARHSCPKCKFSWTSEIPPTVMHLRKANFFWINRDQRSFEWFVNLLSQLEMEQAEFGNTMERFLEMHMYITSALQKNDIKAVGLQLAMDLVHQMEKRDLITGLKTRTNAGRPNWDKVFKQLQDKKKGKVTVFYCGPPQLAKILRYKCGQFGFKFKKESF